MSGQRTCSVEDCGRVHLARGLCKKHYYREREAGRLQAYRPVRPSRSGCSVSDCDRPHDARGFCAMHYARWRQYGSPGLPKRPTRSSVVCVVEGCGAVGGTRDLCRYHYGRWQRLGPAGLVPPPPIEHGTLEGWRAKCRCPECRRARLDANNEARRLKGGAEKQRHWQRRAQLQKYGLTLDGYDALLKSQGGGCGVCGETKPNPDKDFLPVDHDHDTGAVRGILCQRCNVAAGMLLDNPERARALAEYLERHLSQRT